MVWDADEKAVVDGIRIPLLLVLIVETGEAKDNPEVVLPIMEVCDIELVVWKMVDETPGPDIVFIL